MADSVILGPRLQTFTTRGHANLGYKVTLRDEPGAALHIVLLLTDVNGNQEFCLVRFVLSERMFRL